MAIDEKQNHKKNRMALNDDIYTSCNEGSISKLIIIGDKIIKTLQEESYSINLLIHLKQIIWNTL